MKNQRKNLNQKSRFDLEDKMMAAWSTKQDLELFLRHYIDQPTVMTEDEVWNAVYGIVCLHNMRMQEMWDTYESLIKERKL